MELSLRKTLTLVLPTVYILNNNEILELVEYDFPYLILENTHMKGEWHIDTTYNPFKLMNKDANAYMLTVDKLIELAMHKGSLNISSEYNIKEFYPKIKITSRLRKQKNENNSKN